MKESTIKNHNVTTYVREFDSLAEFYDYITQTPVNIAFTNQSHSSIKGTESFTQTKSFEEAVGLFKNGWREEAIRLEKMLKDKAKDTHIKTKARPTYSVEGFQCSVPRYLQGMPDSMINRKNVPVKDKVITINKEINYNAMTSTSTIEAESVKALSLINNIEAQGHRCNLNLVLSTERTKGKTKTREMAKIRIKSANERLNVSKLAFPLVHPSMLRRLLFRYIEIAPTVTRDYVWGYGSPTATSTVRGLLKQLGYENEYVIPCFLPENVNDVKSLQDLK